MKTYRQLKITYILAIILAAIILCFFILWSRQHSHHQKNVQLAHDAIDQYTDLLKITTPLRFKQLLPVIDALDKAKTGMEIDNAGIFNYNSAEDIKLQTTLDNNYHITLEKLFLPLLANYYERAIIKNFNNPIMLYSFLNAYLMLTQPKTIDTHYLLTTANMLIPPTYHSDFKKYLLAGINDNFSGLPEETAIVTMARKNFSLLSLDQQAIIVLFNENINSTDVFKKLDWFSSSTLQAPVIYTKEGFNDTVNNLLPIATNSVLFGNLALGLRQNTSMNPNDLSKLVYNLYLTQYGNYWESLLQRLNIKSLNNVDDLQKMLDNFGSSESELTSVMTVIHNNTDLPQLNYLNKSIQTINNLFDTRSQTLAALQFKFADTANQLANFTKKDRIHWINQNIEIGNYNPINLDLALPAPLNSWLENISQQYWQINLNIVLQDINQLWQTQIYALYQQHFFEHFPFAANEFPDADLDNFIKFFEPQGILDNFVQENLSNFIDKKRLSWAFRQFPGFTQSSNDTVATVQKLQMITHMFFNNTENPTLQFSLAPILMTPNIKQASVIFNHIALNADQNSPNVDIPITWQLHQNDKVTLQFLDDNNQIVSFSKTGTWAWLRILADNKVQAVDPTNYYIEFNSGVLQAQYRLKTDNSNNPFELSVISSLVLPKDFFS